MNALSRSRTLVALGAVLLLPGCTATLLQFLVPLTAFGGSTVEVVVVGTHSNGASGDRIGAVLQLPPGFAALGAMTPNGDIGGNPIPVTMNEPGLLALYTEEPGTT
ncbi:MAG TPA: hypothetical protein VFD82_20975, partial [Planctomycetota bacterium]|nr:hypothetical protein [Planctomycetota bacterium]